MSGTVEELRGEFASRLRETIDRCREVGYNPSTLENMLNSGAGAVTLAKKFLLTKDPQYGLRRLAGLGRLELSIESILLEEKFKPLFSDQDREIAKFRLENPKL